KAQGLALFDRKGGQGVVQHLPRQFERSHRSGFDVIEATRVLDHGGIAGRTHGSQYAGHRLVDAGIVSALESEQRIERRQKLRLARIEPPDPNVTRGFTIHRTAPAKASRTGWMRVRFSLSEAWLTIRRELMGMISSTSTRLFAFRVPPLETRSTIASASPTSGASSIEP